MLTAYMNEPHGPLGAPAKRSVKVFEFNCPKVGSAKRKSREVRKARRFIRIRR